VVDSDEGSSLNTYLLTTGILVSIGFVELLMFVETEHGYKIDLIDADPAQFSIIKRHASLR
jgi:hypothetical protein